MRKLIAGAFISVDGVIQAPGGPEEDPTGGFAFGGWATPYFEETLFGFLGEVFDKGDYDLLLGRRTYDIFAAHWPYHLDNAIGQAFDRVRKYARGHHVVYRANETNRCPGCGRAQWYIGRMTAECGFCGTAVPLAEAKWSGGGQADAPANLNTSAQPGDDEVRARLASASNAANEAIDWSERRRHERVAAAGRTLQLLIDGSPHSFAVHNLSASGLMGDDPVGLEPMSTVQVRFEGGILVPAQVRWTDGPLTGLAFSAPVLLDLSRTD